jgi:hypothetical protein
MKTILTTDTRHLQKHLLLAVCDSNRCSVEPASHIYKVLDRPPTAMDVSVRWSKYWNVYLYKSGEKDLSDKLEALYENEQLGPLLEGNDHWQIGKGEKESTYFECSLPSE